MASVFLSAVLVLAVVSFLVCERGGSGSFRGGGCCCLAFSEASFVRRTRTQSATHRGVSSALDFQNQQQGPKMPALFGSENNREQEPDTQNERETETETETETEAAQEPTQERASPTDRRDSFPRHVVIAGGGIIGTSIAYYLARDHPDSLETLTLVDPTGAVGSCASGKAGGFLARDWRDGTPLQELQRSGFDLHQELADGFAEATAADTETTREHPTDYRRLTCAAVAVDETGGDDPDGNGPQQQQQQQTQRRPNKPPSKKLVDLEWVDPDVVLWGAEHGNGADGNGSDDYDYENDETGGGAVVPMGGEDTIAQVHPRKLCEAMWNQIATKESNGENENTRASVRLVRGKIVRALEKTGSGKGTSPVVVEGVELEDGSVLPADVLVVACGPWTHEANGWFGSGRAVLPDITSVKCHSILVANTASKTERGGTTTEPYSQAVFFDSNGAIGAEGDLEVYPRPDGDSYVNGFANPEGVCLERPGEEAIEEDKISLLRSAMEYVETNRGGGGGAFRERDHTQQVCYWPETPDGLPLIGEIPGIGGAYVAAGHSVWGILQGPATGKAVAELIATGRSESIDLAPFRVGRFYGSEEEEE